MRVRGYLIALATIVILGLAYVIAIPRTGSHRAQFPVTKAMIEKINAALYEYRNKTGSFPAEKEGLDALVRLQLLKDPWDAWGSPFRYRLIDGKPVVTSAGPDRHFDTADDFEGRIN